MIKSMTGFGRCEVAEAERKITVEINPSITVIWT